MSFSSEIKEELSKLPSLANKENVKYEFLGYLATSNIQIEGKQVKKIKFTTENEYNINRFSKLLNNLLLNKYEIKIVGKTYSITANMPEIEEIGYKNIDSNMGKLEDKKQTSKKQNIILKNCIIEGKENLAKALTRGAFLGSGSMNNPQRTYHLEVDFFEYENAELFLEILKSYNIKFKYMAKAEEEHSIYTKNGEEISKFLAFIGATHAMLQFEETRVYRDIRNNVNRKVNCETANLNKTVNSALKQIEAIKQLQKRGELENLSEGLQEIANLRIMNPEASLKELGEMLKEPIGKSGVNHRLKAIEKIAKGEN